MANIAIIWELGSDLGHVTKLVPLANQLSAKGHKVFLIFKEIETLSRFSLDQDVAIIQTPCAREIPYKGDVYSFSDILIHRGFKSKSEYSSLRSSWLWLFETIQPDMVIYDFAPTALAASLELSFKKVILGTSNGYAEVCPNSRLSDICPWQKKDESLLVKSDYYVNDLINGLITDPEKKLEKFSDLYKADKTMLYTLPELDMYGDSRTNTYYCQQPKKDFNFQKPVWLKPNSDRIFCYLKSRHASFSLAYGLLKKMDISACIYAPDMDSENLSELQTDKIHLSNNPFDTRTALKESELVICHGGAGLVNLSLLAGVPLFIFPTQYEQANTANVTDRLKVSESAGQFDSEAEIFKKLQKTLVYSIYTERAQAIKEKYNNANHMIAEDQVCSEMERLLA